MEPFVRNELLGVVFLAVATAQVLLMFYAWRFPYDKERSRSSAPRPVVWAHRILGYLYLVIYIFLMWQMVPRLWSYQVELPARTVAHLVLGMAIGAILLVKLAIVRFFRHMEAQLVPALGVSLFVCTLVLVGLALPLTLREAFLRDAAIVDDSVRAERLERVRVHLPKVGLDDRSQLEFLASAEGLIKGRTVLTNKCVQCHDLRTVLARPRTPGAWRQTVSRMSTRSTILNPISEAEQWAVTAYLIAISPTLQSTLRQKRSMDQVAAASQRAAIRAGQRMAKAGDAPFDEAAAKALFAARCSQCHSPALVEANPPPSADAAMELVSRMVRNGLRGTDEELATIIQYLARTYGAKPAAPDAAPSGAREGEDVVVKPFGSELRFAESRLTAKAGTQVKLVLDNTGASITHNLAVLRDADAIDDVMATALGAGDKGYLPRHDAILAGIPATPGGNRVEVTFEVPAPGEYPFICLMPAHGFTMRGVLRSVE